MSTKLPPCAGFSSPTTSCKKNRALVCMDVIAANETANAIRKSMNRHLLFAIGLSDVVSSDFSSIRGMGAGSVCGLAFENRSANSVYRVVATNTALIVIMEYHIHSGAFMGS